MIFLTVGAQMPFDRLIRAVDTWVAHTPDTDVFAQIGRTSYQPRHLKWIDFLDPAVYLRRMCDASLIVTHAGMGSIITARELAKPVLVMPRRADLGETRNDHQSGTARRFHREAAITVAGNPAELVRHLSRLHDIPPSLRVSTHASLCLLSTLSRFIKTGSANITSSPEPGESPNSPLPFPAAPAPDQPGSNRAAA